MAYYYSCIHTPHITFLLYIGYTQCTSIRRRPSAEFPELFLRRFCKSLSHQWAQILQDRTPRSHRTSETSTGAFLGTPRHTTGITRKTSPNTVFLPDKADRRYHHQELFYSICKCTDYLLYQNTVHRTMFRRCSSRISLRPNRGTGGSSQSTHRTHPYYYCILLLL